MTRRPIALALFAAGPAAAMPQQDKMKTCNADAKTKALAGDARKKFMTQLIDIVLGTARRMGWSQRNVQHQSFASVHAIDVPPAAGRSV